MTQQHSRIWSAVVLVLALGVVGFCWLGWAPSSTSRRPAASAGRGGDTGALAHDEHAEQPAREAAQVVQPAERSGGSGTVQGFVLGLDNQPVTGAVVTTHPGGVQLAVTESTVSSALPTIHPVASWWLARRACRVHLPSQAPQRWSAV